MRNRVALLLVYIGIMKESRPGERRVAAIPATVETFVSWKWNVLVQSGSGLEAGHTDESYKSAGAEIVESAGSAAEVDLVLRVGPPTPDDLDLLHKGSTVAGFLDPFVNDTVVRKLTDLGLTGLAVEAIPRTTLAQSMDALSSQANIAGYAAALAAAQISPRLLPMMVTAAGTIPPSKAVILGVGVAGLQAIATMRRLGAVVQAYDVRPETREQVESLGAKFIEAPTAEADEGGYAREVGNDLQARQWEILAPYVADADLVITTAQVPGRIAPRLITSEMVDAMKPGSVIIDMAAASGGNVEGSKPDQEIDRNSVLICGPTNLAGAVPADASRMYARNLVALLERTRTDDGGISIDLEDDIIGPTAVVYRGEVRHPKCNELLRIRTEGSS